MELLLFMALFLLIVLPSMLKAAEVDAKELAPTEKVCPPHKWNWKKYDNSDVEYIICDACKKKPNQL